MKNILTSNMFVLMFNGILKYIIGILSNSMALFSDGLFNISQALKYSGANYTKDKKSKKSNNVYNVLIGGIIVMLGAVLILNVINSKVGIVKWYVVLASVICYLVTNISASLKYVFAFNDKNKEIINVDRNYIMSLTIPVIVVISFILTKCSKWFSYLKYGDLVGTTIIAVLIIIMGLSYIINNIKGLTDDEINLDEIKETIKLYPIIKCINKNEIYTYGSSKKLVLDISLEDSASLMNTYQELLNLTQQIFKKNKNIEVISIIKNPYIVKKAVKKSARNSGSRNSKKNTKKKNSSKKNKKH